MKRFLLLLIHLLPALCPPSLLLADEKLDHLIAEIAQTEIEAKRAVGLTIGVARGDKTLHLKGYGLADIENALPASGDSVYRIGSITKTFTAAAIMLLVEDGKLSLGDPLTKFLPDYPGPGGAATVRNLLQHTSGIFSFTDAADHRQILRDDMNHQQVLARFTGHDLHFAPGDDYRYCNSGFYLLGMIIEKVSGLSYEEFLKQRIFGPLELKSITYDRHAKIIPNRARGYSLWGEHLVNAPYLSMTKPFAAGALVSNAGDLLQWSSALRRNVLLKPDSFQQMITPGRRTNGKAFAYGLGCQVETLDGHRVIRHGGGIPGFVSEWTLFPESELSVVVLTNTTSTKPRALADRIARSLLPPKAEAKAQVTKAEPISPKTGSERSPNFVLIFTDDQGYQDVGCFGSPDIRTPRLDALAAEGMRFTDFHAQPFCGPSRTALMTGCYPMRVAERGNIKEVHPVVHSDEVTVAEVLKSRGYATGCFGKWDLAGHSQTDYHLDLFPTRQGFDTFFGTPTSNDRRVSLFRDETLIEEEADMATLTRRYTDEAIAFMRENRDQPFFVYLPHTMPHTRLDASEPFKGKSKRGLYGDVIEEIDFNVGRIIDTLRELEVADNTYLLYPSDNGPWLSKNQDHRDGHLATDHGGSAGPLRSGKVSTFEGGTRVPTILWGPGRVPAKSTCGQLASTLDVLPTFAALAGADDAVPGDRVIDGENIRHLFHGDFDKADPDKAFFYYLRVQLQAVRQGKWKLHLPRDSNIPGLIPFSVNRHIAPVDREDFTQPFLVDLETDLGETTNVAANHPQVVEHLLSLAETMREDLGDYDRVGTNMRFFDLAPEAARPTTPPLPKRPKPKLKVKAPAKGK